MTADIFIPFSPDGHILWSRIKSREQIMSIFIDQALAYSQAGTIRGPRGWNGGDYRESLKDISYPVICHELGQWCAYPDFDVIDKFTGYLQPGEFRDLS